jgi:3-hydroxyisobutyrate dehydrogenase-like beta-hydroxyacid dehydrogenase
LGTVTGPGARRVAVIGVGRMGAAMAERLRDTGFAVSVYNRSAHRAREVADRLGVGAVDTPAEAARWVSDGGGETSGPGVLLVSLADDNACREVYLGTDGLVSALSPTSVVADTSTIDPGTAHELFAAVAARGAAMLDSPVSGSVPAALAGGLTVMVGGEAAALERARLVLAEKAGVPLATFYDVIADSAAAAPFVGYKRQAFEHPESAPVAFSLDLVGKDLRLILQLADRVGARMPQARTGLDSVDEAVRSGLGDADMSALAGMLRTS